METTDESLEQGRRDLTQRQTVNIFTYCLYNNVSGSRIANMATMQNLRLHAKNLTYKEYVIVLKYFVTKTK
jgi:hypothetical protein